MKYEIPYPIYFVNKFRWVGTDTFYHLLDHLFSFNVFRRGKIYSFYQEATNKPAQIGTKLHENDMQENI